MLNFMDIAKNVKTYKTCIELYFKKININKELKNQGVIK